MEIFKSIKGYEGYYEVSNLGRVKSLKRKGCLNDRILSSGTSCGGYYQVVLRKDNKSKNCHVHKLVAITFLGHELNEQKLVIDHIDNNTQNNNVNNLQIISQRKNASKDKKGYTSEYIGVSWYKNMGKWVSKIVINGKPKHLGYFDLEIDAANAYKKELLKLNK